MHKNIQIENKDFQTNFLKFSKTGSFLYKHRISCRNLSFLYKYFPFEAVPEKVVWNNGKEFDNDTVRELLIVHKVHT